MDQRLSCKNIHTKSQIMILDYSEYIYYHDKIEF